MGGTAAEVPPDPALSCAWADFRGALPNPGLQPREFYPGSRGVLWNGPNPRELSVNLDMCVDGCIFLERDHTSPESHQQVSVPALEVKIRS